LFYKFIFIEKIHLFVRNKLFLDIKKTTKKVSDGKTRFNLIKKLFDSIIFIYQGPSMVNFVLIAAIFHRLDIFLWFYGLTLPIIVLALMFFEIHRGYDSVEEFFK